MKAVKKLFFAALCCVSMSSFAQQSTLPQAQFGAFQNNATTTVQQVLGNPRLIVMDPIAVVSDFKFSIVPAKGKSYGPVTNTGIELTAEEMKALEKMPNGKIVLSDIHVKMGTKTVTLPNMTINISDK